MTIQVAANSNPPAQRWVETPPGSDRWEKAAPKPTSILNVNDPEFIKRRAEIEKKYGKPDIREGQGKALPPPYTETTGRPRKTPPPSYAEATAQRTSLFDKLRSPSTGTFKMKGRAGAAGAAGVLGILGLGYLMGKD